MNAAVYSLDNKTGVIARRGIPFKCEFFAKRNLYVSVCRGMSYVSVTVSLFSYKEIRSAGYVSKSVCLSAIESKLIQSSPSKLQLDTIETVQ